MSAPVPASWKQWIVKLIDERIASYARAGSMRNASLTEGGSLVIKGGAVILQAPDGGVSSYWGSVAPALPDGTYQPGFILYREDGSLAAAMYDPDPDPDGPGDYKQFFALYDRSNGIIVSDDTDSGVGLARPYLNFFFYSARFSDTPSVTTSGTFETLWTTTTYKQHPRAYVAAASVADSGTTGEVRVLVNGVQLGSTGSITASSAAHAFGPSAVAGAHMSTMVVQVQGRVTSGAGAVRIVPQMGVGLQS